jgi:pyruvate dehydrogenase E1 component alpha subunit
MPTPLHLHKELVRLRRSEELLASLYKGQTMATPAHFAIGQEGIAVGVCAALDRTKDVVFAAHRSHYAYLASGGSFEALCAELYGRETGCSKGRGGSVHLTHRSTGFIISSAILGETIAVAAGAALAFKMNKEKRVAVCFFGEAAMEEGIVYETMNYAAIHKLPLLLVCENNSYSTESPLSVRQPEGTELCDRALMFHVAASRVDGNDVNAVYESAKKGLAYVRSGQPVMIEVETYRYLEHVGPYTDQEQGRTYRSAAELAAWQANDPISVSADGLVLSHKEIEKYDAEIQLELKAAAERAYAAPMPDRSTLFDNVW